MEPRSDDPIQIQRARTVWLASLTILIGSSLHLILSTFVISASRFNFALARAEQCAQTA